MEKDNSKKSKIIIFKTSKSGVEVEVKLEKETIWLTQTQIALLFGTQRPAITKHLNNIFNSGELNKDSVSSILEHTASDGKTYLEAISFPLYEMFSPQFSLPLEERYF